MTHTRMKEDRAEAHTASGRDVLYSDIATMHPRIFLDIFLQRHGHFLSHIGHRHSCKVFGAGEYAMKGSVSSCLQ